MSQKMQRWTRFEIKILSLKELRGKPGCVNTDKALIGEFSEDTGRAITPVRAELRRAVRNCQITTGQRCVCVTSSVLIIWLASPRSVTSRMNYSPQVEVFVCQWPHVWGNEREGGVSHESCQPVTQR